METQLINEIPNMPGMFLMARGIEYDSYQRMLEPMQLYKIEYVMEKRGYLITPQTNGDEAE